MPPVENIGGVVEGCGLFSGVALVVRALPWVSPVELGAARHKNQRGVSLMQKRSRSLMQKRDVKIVLWIYVAILLGVGALATLSPSDMTADS